MDAPYFGHVVLNVSSLTASTRFYCEVWGLKEVARNLESRMVFLSFGVKDHDVALREAGAGAKAHDEAAVGVRQVAFCVGRTIDELRAFRTRLAGRGIPIQRIHEHVAQTSLYFSDPDGIELEAYVEHPPQTWRGARRALRFSRAVTLD